MNVVLLLHSLVRFLILLVAIAGIVETLVALTKKSETVRVDRALGSTFLGLYDAQALLGLLIILLGGLTQAVHPLVMFAGLIVAHGLSVLARRAEAARAQMTRLAMYVVPLAIILVGLAVIQHLPT